MRTRTTAAALVGILLSVAIAAAAEDLASRIEAARTAEIERVESELKETSGRLLQAQRKHNTGPAKSYKKKVGDLKERLADLKNRKKPYAPALDMHKLATGQIGTIGGQWWNLRVVQVLEEGAVLAEYEYLARTTKIRGSGERGMTTIHTGAEQRTGPLVWIEGLSTDNLVDGKKIQPPDLFEVRGTKQYQTAMGSSKTVFWLSAVKR